MEDRPSAFVLMPFDPEFDEIYNLFIADALDEAGYTFFRADDIRNQQNILRDIVTAIETSDLVLADLTGANANVYYELGIAHALGKPVILLTQSISELPFDLRAYRVVAYSTHFAVVQKAREELVALARGARDGTVVFGSPITDFLSRMPAPGATVLARSREASEAAEEEAGFIDHLVNVENGFEQLTENVAEIGTRTEAIGAETESLTEQISAATANPSSGTSRHLQNLMRGHADKLIQYVGALTRANVQYSEILGRTENSLEGVISAQEPETEDAKEQLASFLDVLAGVEESAMSSRSAFARLADTMDALPKIERHLTRATRQCSVELRRYVDNVDQTIAMISRAGGIGERILRHRNQA